MTAKMMEQHSFIQIDQIPAPVLSQSTSTSGTLTCKIVYPTVI